MNAKCIQQQYIGHIILNSCSLQCRTKATSTIMGFHTGYRRCGRTDNEGQIAFQWSSTRKQCGRDIETTRAATTAYDGVGYKGGKRMTEQN